jgi:hypothetical protein
LDDLVEQCLGDVVAVDLVPGDYEVMGTMIGVGGARSEHVVKPFERVTVITLGATTGSVDDPQVRRVGGRQRERRQGILAPVAERTDRFAGRK